MAQVKCKWSVMFLCLCDDIIVIVDVARELHDVTGGSVGSQVFPNGMGSYVYNMGVTEHSLHNTSLININHRIHLDQTEQPIPSSFLELLLL